LEEESLILGAHTKEDQGENHLKRGKVFGIFALVQQMGFLLFGKREQP
jgi:hypothetical protein